ncbi:hypothetical protein D7V97_02875 [Corallococcus sp. CA053C]|nr:hypothetical protein D7V97_02875 [Corallococcus sp. CA053C]
MPSITGRKWVSPIVSVPGGGQFRTTIYYGPWQCSAQLMSYCQNKCAGEGHVLQGCMWLADVKLDFVGTVLQTGSRFGMTHCCCNYSTLSTAQTAAQRQRWENIRDGFREQWARRFGQWPTDAQGNNWPAHHLRDLHHGGNPTDWENLLPMPQDIHGKLNALYNQCYANNPPWSTVGIDYPYGE